MVTKTLSHDRDIEWGYYLKRLPRYPNRRRLLDFGPMPPSAPTSQTALNRGYDVTAIGLESLTLSDPYFTYIQGDILSVRLQPDMAFDYILNISTIEHVGLGRYGDPIGGRRDLEAMRRLLSWSHSETIMYLTLPLGIDSVVGNYHRVYGSGRLGLLLEGWQIIEQSAWRKDDEDKWESCTVSRALVEQPTQLPVELPLHLYYAIGGFTLCPA